MKKTAKRQTMKRKRILITGAHGFLGSHLVDHLKQQGYQKLFCPTHREYDLTRPNRIRALLKKTKPQIVLHLAARVGGIGANQANPGTFFYQNLVMGVHLIEESRLHGVEKFVALGTVCGYPKFTPVPFKEKNLWNGYPEETNAPYGLAKKMMLVQSKGYRQQYGFNSIFVMPVNLYGQGDDFDLHTSHVIPALIRKFIEAKARGEKQVVLWGDGSPSREFLYVEDCARAIRLAMERYNRSEPVNFGSGKEIKIKALAEKIKKLTGFRGKIIWDTSKPNGQPRRRVDTSRAKKVCGFTAKVPFDVGLKKTIDWYKKEISA